MRHDFSLSRPSLLLALGGGQVELITTSTGTDVTVEIDDAGRGTASGITVEQKRRTIVVRGDRSRFSDAVTIRITAPSDTSVDARMATASLTHTGTLSSIRVHQAAGSITLGTITDSLVAKTGAGDVAVDTVRGSAVVHTGAGKIRIGRIDGSARIATGLGDIELGEAANVLDLKSGAGRLRIRRAHGDVSIKAGAGPVEIAHFDGAHLSVRNHSGDVTIGIPAGLPVWRDIVTVTGHLTTTLPATGEPERGAKHAEIRAFTRHGDVTLQLAEQPAA